MSYGEQYFTTYNRDGVEHRFSILQKDTAADSSRLVSAGDFFRASIELNSPREYFNRPAQSRELEYSVRIESDAQLSFFESVAGSEQDAYRIKYERDSSDECTVYMQADMIEIPVGPYPKTVKVRGKDLTYLKGQQYPLSEGRVRLIEILADVLDMAGLDLDIQTITSFDNANITPSGDWLNQIYSNKDRIRIFGEEGEDDQTIDAYEVLQKLCTNFGLMLRQENGVWLARNVTDLANDPVTIFDYNSAGTQSGSSSTDIDAFVDGSSLHMLPTGVERRMGGYKRVTSTYDHKSQQKTISLPRRFEVLAGDVQRDFELDPFFSDGNQTIELGFGVQAEGDGDEVSGFTQIEVRAGEVGDFSYLSNDGTWGGTQDSYRIDLVGFDDNGDFAGPDNTIDSAGLYFRAGVRIAPDNIPSDADGTLRIRFKAATGEHPDGDRILDTTYYDVSFKLIGGDSDEAGGRSSSYYIENSRDFSEDYDMGVTWYGDGPSFIAPGAFFYDSGGGVFQLTNDDWRRTGGSAEIKFHKLLMREVMDTHRTPTELIKAQLWGDFRTYEIINYDSKRYVVLGGDYNGRLGRWDVWLMRVNVQADDDTLGVIIDEDDDDVGGGGGTDPDPDPPDAVGELTSAVSDTTATSIPVEVYAGKAIQSGKDYYIWNNVKRRPISFTASEDLEVGKDTLDIEEQVIVAPSGSQIYKEEGQKETERVIQVEQQTATESARASLSASIQNERETQAIGTISSEVTGTTTSIPLENIPQEIKLNDGDILTLLDITDSAEGESADVTVDGDQTLTAGTGTVSISSKTFSHTYPVGATLFEPARGLTARVTATARVTTDNADNIATVQAQADSNSAQVVLKAESTSGEITKMALVQLDSSVAGGSAITLAADQIKISGDTTFTNGFDPSDGRTTIRSDSEPTQRPSGDDLQEGDIWLDTNDGDKPYSWNGSSWIAEYTNIDGGSITTGAIQSGNFVAGSTGWQIDTNGDAEFNTVTIRDGTIINPTFSGSAVGLINTVATVGDLPASGGEDGDTYYVEDEPGGLYVWRDADSEWKDTRDGQFILADSISASKIQVATLSAIAADIGVANISNTLTMGASGEITNSAGDYTLDADGLELEDGGTATGASSLKWVNGTQIRASIYADSDSTVTITAWDTSTSTRNIAMKLAGGGAGNSLAVETLLNTRLASTTGQVALGDPDNFNIPSSPSPYRGGLWAQGHFIKIAGAGQQPLELPTYTDSTRPSASSAGAGALIYNTTDNRMQSSDGSAWQRVSYV